MSINNIIKEKIKQIKKLEREIIYLEKQNYKEVLKDHLKEYILQVLKDYRGEIPKKTLLIKCELKGFSFGKNSFFELIKEMGFIIENQGKKNCLVRLKNEN